MDTICLKFLAWSYERYLILGDCFLLCKVLVGNFMCSLWNLFFQVSITVFIIFISFGSLSTIVGIAYGYIYKSPEFFRSLVYQFGNNVARLYFVLSAVSTGMFISSAGWKNVLFCHCINNLYRTFVWWWIFFIAYLPSSFAMYCCLLAYGGWFNRNYPVRLHEM